MTVRSDASVTSANRKALNGMITSAAAVPPQNPNSQANTTMGVAANSAMRYSSGTNGGMNARM